MTKNYELYYSILEKYNLAQFDEAINCNAFLCCINKDFYSEFENIEKIIFDCITELNSHCAEFDDFFLFYRTCVNDEYNDTIVITSARKLHEDLHDDLYF